MHSSASLNTSMAVLVKSALAVARLVSLTGTTRLGPQPIPPAWPMAQTVSPHTTLHSTTKTSINKRHNKVRHMAGGTPRAAFKAGASTLTHTCPPHWTNKTKQNISTQAKQTKTITEQSEAKKPSAYHRQADEVVHVLGSRSPESDREPVEISWG